MRVCCGDDVDFTVLLTWFCCEPKIAQKMNVKEKQRTAVHTVMGCVSKTQSQRALTTLR